ncbi:MAG: phospho-sugar mutase [Bacillota bacterium]|nr:phospho-sugar mutase [Bacillota bacterium]
MSRVHTLYQLWSEHTYFDKQTRAELLAIADQPGEIEDRFYSDLAFGTGGLRGVLGAGTNRINQYTVARAADGFARSIAARGQDARERGIVISYDSRHYSADFALLTAQVFVGYKIRVRLSDELRPVPLLSFAIRRYGAVGGVMITASHNPARYNGFKAYGEDGGQLPPEEADAVVRCMDEIKDMTQLHWPDIQQARNTGLLEMIGPELDQTYNDMLLTLSINPEVVQRHQDMKIVYTPLHGTGNKPVRRILASLGFTNVIVVPEQEKPDPDFPTVDMPNPEERAALALAIDLADREDAALVIATDPDADRTGLCVRTRDGSYTVLSGNQIGLLLTDYILSTHRDRQTMPEKPFVVTTIVSTKLMRRVAAHYGVTLYECLTGFKFIGEIIKEKDECSDMHFLFGFEESYGYLAGTDVRDKDGVVTSMLIAEMAAVARDRGLTLADLLQDLYGRFGFAAEKTVSLTMEGKEGLDKIRTVMASLRKGRAAFFADLPVRAINDYDERIRVETKTGRQDTLDLPQSDVLLYEMDGLDWFCVRPSGTEPKIKIYFGCYGDDQDQCDHCLQKIRTLVETHIQAAMTGEPS